MEGQLTTLSSQSCHSNDLTELWEFFINKLWKRALKSILRRARKKCIPCWKSEIEDAYQNYCRSTDFESKQEQGNTLLTILADDRRDKGIDLVQTLDFTKLSRRAFQLLRGLDTSEVPKSTCPLKPDETATNLLQNSQIDKELQRKLRKNMQDFLQKKSTKLDLSLPIIAHQMY